MHKSGSQQTSIKGQIKKKMLIFLVSVATVQVCYYKMKAEVERR